MQFFMEYQIFSVARPNAVLKEIFLMNLKVPGAFPLYEISISLRSLGSSRCAGFHGRLTWLGGACLSSIKTPHAGGGAKTDLILLTRQKRRSAYTSYQIAIHFFHKFLQARRGHQQKGLIDVPELSQTFYNSFKVVGFNALI